MEVVHENVTATDQLVVLPYETTHFGQLRIALRMKSYIRQFTVNHIITSVRNVPAKDNFSMRDNYRSELRTSSAFG
jgi:hypothetical protein